MAVRTREAPPPTARPTTPPPPLPPQATPPERTSHVAAVAAAATAAALAAGDGKTVPTPPPIALVRAAVATLVDAMNQVFLERRSTFLQYITTTAQRQMPAVAHDRVALLAAEEMRNEAEFQRKSRLRLERDLPEALRIADPGERAKAVAKLLEREKRFLVQREQAAAQRLVASLEAELLKQASPQGAYWQLSPLIRNHCLRCLAMAGKFWPWEVLEANRLPMHPHCGCSLLSLNEAIARKLMTANDVPDKDDAAKLARSLLDQAAQVEEGLSEEQVHALTDRLHLHVAEASVREWLRWGKGSSHGGEFRSKLGGDPGVASTEEALRHLHGTIAGLSGRHVTIRGEAHTVPKAEDWEHKIGSHTYSSPWGTTRIYRDGLLLSEDHQDLGGEEYHPPGDVPDAPTLPLGGRQEGWATDALLPRLPPKDAGDLVPDYSRTKLELGKGAGGSTGAKWAFSKSGDRWLIKTYKGSQDRVATELLANAIYRELGATVAPAGTYYADQHGKPIVALAYPTLPGGTRKIEQPSRELGKHFMADALVGNWDVVGLSDDNVLWQPDGSPARLDQGGTFEFRAQGAPKPYGPVPTEVWTMMSPKGQAFDKMDVNEPEMRDQAAHIAQTLTPEHVHALVKAAPFADKAMAQRIEQGLNNRVQWMHDFSRGEENVPQPLAGKAVGTVLGKDQEEHLHPTPEQHAALRRFTSDERLQRVLQERLRSGEKLSTVQRETRNGLDRLIDHTQTPEDLTLYRTLDPDQLPDLDKLVGKVVKDKAFATATTRRAAAREAPGMLQIHVPAGSRALHTPSIEDIGEDDPHTEVMLPRSSRLRVKRVQRRGGRTIIHAVALDG
jgi:hypothetical protein